MAFFSTLVVCTVAFAVAATDLNDEASFIQTKKIPRATDWNDFFNRMRDGELVVEPPHCMNCLGQKEVDLKTLLDPWKSTNTDTNHRHLKMTPDHFAHDVAEAQWVADAIGVDLQQRVKIETLKVIAEKSAEDVATVMAGFKESEQYFKNVTGMLLMLIKSTPKEEQAQTLLLAMKHYLGYSLSRWVPIQNQLFWQFFTQVKTLHMNGFAKTALKYNESMWPVIQTTQHFTQGYVVAISMMEDLQNNTMQRAVRRVGLAEHLLEENEEELGVAEKVAMESTSQMYDEIAEAWTSALTDKTDQESVKKSVDMIAKSTNKISQACVSEMHKQSAYSRQLIADVFEELNVGKQFKEYFYHSGAVGLNLGFLTMLASIAVLSWY